MLNRIEIDISKILKLWNDDRKTIFREEKKKKKEYQKKWNIGTNAFSIRLSFLRCQVSISDDYRLGVRASPPLIGLTVLTVSLVGSP